MEGLPEPRGIFDEIDSWDAAPQDAFLRHNTRSLTNRRLAGVG